MGTARDMVGFIADRLDRARPGRWEERASTRRAALHARIPVVTEWIRQATVPATSVSVVIATRDRHPLLQQAMASVLNQTHPNVELVVVDDGSHDETSHMRGDDVTLVRTTGVGLAAARNAGLEAATGELVTYLDDDNRMHCDWTRSVAWAFESVPGIGLLYGARLVEDLTHISGPIRDDSTMDNQLPWLHLDPFDADVLKQWNFIDANTMAHRREEPGARFDETSAGVCDWDLAIRLTAVKEALPLPVLACYYMTRGSNRMSRESFQELEASSEAVRKR